MSKAVEAQQREQRLAAKLRENLKRRKAQAKARSDADAQAPEPIRTADDAAGKKP